MDLEQLKVPFAPDDIEWRVGTCGVTQQGKPWAMALAYLNTRAVIDRLDEACGPENWQLTEPKFIEGKTESGFIVGLSIRIDGEWVTKWDGANTTDFESFKGGISGAIKRAAVHWGIGRYLYHLKDSWATCSTEKQKGWNYAKTKDGKVFYWQPPELPAWAVPATSSQKPVSQPQAETPPPSRPDPPAPQPEPAAASDPWLVPDLSSYETRIDDWSTVEHHRRGRKNPATGEVERLPGIPLGQLNTKTVRWYALNWHLPADANEKDKLLRAALNIWLKKQTEGDEAPSEGIPF